MNKVTFLTLSRNVCVRLDEPSVNTANGFPFAAYACKKVSVSIYFISPLLISVNHCVRESSSSCVRQ